MREHLSRDLVDGAPAIGGLLVKPGQRLRHVAPVAFQDDADGLLDGHGDPWTAGVRAAVEQAKTTGAH